MSELLAKKRPKLHCEVCGESNQKVLHRHHIVERTEQHSDNNDFNLAILCSNCHNKLHAGEIHIIGVFPGTKPPTGRILVYVNEKGECNVPGIKEPYYTPKNPSMKVFINEGNKKED